MKVDGGMKTKNHKRKIPAILLLLGVIVLPLSTIGCGGGNDGGGSGTNSSNNTIPGTILEGPVVGATVTAYDTKGQQVGSSVKSGVDATFNIDIPDDATYPIKLVMTGGTDQVTGETLKIELTSIITEKGQTAANISPITTMIYEAALAKAGGNLAKVDSSAVQTATGNVLDNFGFGIDEGQSIADPLGTPIISDNLASYMRASEAAGELVRRIAGTSSSDQNLVFAALGKDLMDGSLDGKQNGTDLSSTDLPSGLTPTELVAKASLQSAIISAEVVGGALEVTKNNGTKISSSEVQEKFQSSMKMVVSTLSDAEAASKLENVIVSDRFKKQGQTALETSINIVGSGTQLDVLKTAFDSVIVGTSVGENNIDATTIKNSQEVAVSTSYSNL